MTSVADLLAHRKAEAETRRAEYLARPEVQEMKRLVAAQDWANLCPEKCDGNCKAGVRCDLSYQPEVDCSYRRETRRQEMAMTLGRIGLPERYRCPQTNQLPPGDYRRSFAGYCDGLETSVREGRGLVILGGIGCGKSHLLALIAWAWANMPQRDEWDGARYVFAPALMEAVFAYSFGRQGLLDDSGQRTDYARWRTSSLLLIDDFDRLVDMTTDEGGGRALARFDAFFEERYASRLATVIAGNCTAARLKQIPELERSVDRWRECMEVLEIGAPSQRQGR